MMLAVLGTLATVLVAATPSAQAGPTTQLVLAVSPGASPQDPAYGTEVAVSVQCTTTTTATDAASNTALADCPPWVRVDRTDGVRDTTPFMRVVDQAVSFSSAPSYPLWFRPEWGPTPINFGGAVDNKPIPLVASGWSARYNGTQVTANSSEITLYYNVSIESTSFELDVKDVSPGTVRLSVRQNTAPNHTYDRVRFDRFVQQTPPGTVPPFFKTSFSYHQESSTGSVVLAFQQPGVYFYGATPSFQGRAAQCTAGGEYDGRPSPKPLAIVVEGPTGPSNATALPKGFIGAVHRTLPLRSAHQFCLIHPNITAFSGSKILLRLCRPDPAQEIPKQPRFVSVIAPRWVTLAPESSETSSHPAAVNTSNPIPGTQLQRWIFESSRWATYNDYVPLYVAFPAAKAGLTVELRVSIYDDWASPPPGDAAQTLHVNFVVTPTVKVDRFFTSITWASGSLLGNGTAESFLETYGQLGFTAVPQVSVQAAVKPGSRVPPFEQQSLYPGNRTTAAWGELGYAPELSGFGGVFHSMLVTPPNATVLAQMGVPAADIPSELLKWQRAVQFHNTTHQIDIAYDGVWFRSDVAEFCHVANITQADLIHADDEGWGQGWATWQFSVASSENALARRLPNEPLSDLAWRMIREMLMDWVGCLSTVAPQTFLAFYGTPFPMQMFVDTNIAGQPSTYGPIHYPKTYPQWLAGFRRHLDAAKPAKSWVTLLPWLTSCTYGQMTAEETLVATLQSFGAGATGFSYFIDSCLDDPAKVLALSTASALFSPYDVLLLEGAALGPPQVPSSLGVLAWSGIKALHETEPSYVLVATPSKPEPHGHRDHRMNPPPPHLVLDVTGDVAATSLGSAGGFIACHLATGETVDLGPGPTLLISLPGPLAATQAVVVTPKSANRHCSAPSPSLWFPKGWQ
eukprot:m.390017 g.390017  ORF g.390017 m.390017 type:complete len:912 (-) comp20074_c5_seq2:72-2807(-)